MNDAVFDELAGRIEALARAVVVLARTMERETDMDGPSLSQDLRAAVGPHAATAQLRIAHNNLQALAQELDDQRSQRQAGRYLEITGQRLV